ncbi:Fic/DOC family protein [Enhygromyxa salina]|uniref:Fic/DOC family protein n=1 Tax=Enhygromyxa salina TaxID=215803 RepID=A0A2S9XX50_9BACT|nr:Fic/DOC family protein [Enhygromyxa salina]
MAPRTRNFRQLHEASELLLEKLGMLGPKQRAAFDERFRMSWIFHDFALEGTVLSVAEIKAAIDPEIISTPSLIPAYNHIASLYEGIDYILQSRGKRLTLNLDWLKRLHQILLPADKKDQVQYRKDNPIHRMYFHDLAQADKISYRMRKLTDWFRTEECKRAHPIELACEVHREIIRILPWPEISGRVARLAMNHILINESYWPAIVHHVDRHRYYDTLQRDQDELLELVVDSIREGMVASNKLYQGIVDSSRGF